MRVIIPPLPTIISIYLTKNSSLAVPSASRSLVQIFTGTVLSITGQHRGLSSSTMAVYLSTSLNHGSSRDDSLQRGASRCWNDDCARQHASPSARRVSRREPMCARSGGDARAARLHVGWFGWARAHLFAVPLSTVLNDPDRRRARAQSPRSFLDSCSSTRNVERHLTRGCLSRRRRGGQAATEVAPAWSFIHRPFCLQHGSTSILAERWRGRPVLCVACLRHRMAFVLDARGATSARCIFSVVLPSHFVLLHGASCSDGRWSTLIVGGMLVTIVWQLLASSVSAPDRVMLALGRALAECRRFRLCRRSTSSSCARGTEVMVGVVKGVRRR